MKKKNTVLFILIALDIVLLVANLLSHFSYPILATILEMQDKEAASISIIGGADGPTAIFVAGKMPATDYLLPIGLIVALIVTAIYIVVCKNKR